MKNALSSLYNFRGNLSRRDFLIYWLWVYLLPKVWPFIGGGIYCLVYGVEFKPLEMTYGFLLTLGIHLLLMSFFIGAMWRRLNDIGFAITPKLIICSLSFFMAPFGWMLQLTLLMLNRRNSK